MNEPSGISLEEAFRHPPVSCRPHVWWHWLNDSITREGIAADLRAFAEAGMAGVQIFQAAVGDRKPYLPAGIKFQSQAWSELFRFAVEEADRLGLEVAFHNCGGYSESGGPHVTFDQAMQKLVWSETRISGPSFGNITLPCPHCDFGMYPGPPQPGQRPRYSRQGDGALEYYRDVAVLAFAAPAGGCAALRPIRIITSPGLEGDTAVWLDEDARTSARLPLPRDNAPAWIVYEFESVATVRSVTLSFLGFDWFREADFQVSADGVDWRTICPLNGIIRWDRLIPCTTAVPETQSRWFRIRFFSSMPRAVCLDVAQVLLQATPRLDRWEIKAAYSSALIQKKEAPPASCDFPGLILNLTSFLKSDGALEWTAPPGDWTILRIGHAPIGVINHPAMPEATGLEVDKLSKDAVTAYFHGGPAEVIALVRDFAGITLTGLLMDSWEVFSQNWTPALIEEFHRRRGYDPVPWLPAIAGHVVVNPDLCERFLFDFRKTLSDLLIENHYETMRTLANACGLKLFAEATGRFIPTIADNFAVKAHIDIPMGEFWNEEAFSIDARQTAAAAHLCGKTIAAAEAFTSEPEGCGWKESPATFKRLGDRYFASGVNMFILHTAVHQPWIDREPGLALGAYGSHFARTNGWLALAGRPWTDYLSRCQFLLRRGIPVIDCCYFVGEDVPNDLPPREKLDPPLPPGFDYDACSEEAILHRMTVQDGKLVLPDGLAYQILILPGHERLTLATLQKIRELIRAGATVYGPRPTTSPSLTDYPEGDAEIRNLAAEIWGSESAPVRNFGQGRICFGLPLSELLSEPDFAFSPSAGEILCFHRRDGEIDFYFVSNQSVSSVATVAFFRTKGKSPELWHPETGEITALASWEETERGVELPLRLEGQEAVFVVFREKRAPKAPASMAIVEEQRDLRPVWQLAFPANETFSLEQLVSWTDLPAVRYFSGTAEYRCSFEMEQSFLNGNGPILLDLGDVGTFAEVTLNDEKASLLWHAPYQLDVGSSLRAGPNDLRIHVTNLLANSLIGDLNRPPPDRRHWAPFNPWTAESGLCPSGLLGPVRLVKRPPDWRQLLS